MESKDIKKHVVKIIKETTNEITSIMNSISDAFETKQYHVILFLLDQMKQTITSHRLRIDLICVHWYKKLDEDTIVDYKKGNELLIEKFQAVHDNVMKDVISCFNLDGNEFH